MYFVEVEWLKTLDSESKLTIETQSGWIFPIFEQIGKIIEHATESLEDPLIGVFYKSRYDYIQDLRRYYKQIRKTIKKNLKQFPPFYNSQSLERELANKFILFSRELKQFLILWSKKLNQVSFENEKILVSNVTEFNQEIMKMQSRFTVLLEAWTRDSKGKMERIETCPRCNKEIDDETVFCKYCGSKIDGKTRYIPQGIRNEVWTRDNGQCVECGTREDLQFDHIIPFEKGGASTPENLQILCKECNLKKSNKI